ncbi:MAG: RNA-guided endonuclease TnpB family protein [Candidatus Omnitrophota bacterium]
MMTTKKKMAFKYRAYPTRSQQTYFDETIHSCWWFYRFVLHHYEDDHKIAKKSYYDEEFSWYENRAYHPYWYRDIPKTKIKRILNKKTGMYEEKIVKNLPRIPNECYILGSPLRHQGTGNTSTYKLLQKIRDFAPQFSRYNLPRNKFTQVNSRYNLPNIPAVVMQEVLERVAHAFDKFWKEGGGYPNYPKERNYRSVTWTSGITIYKEEGLIKLSRMPGLLQIVYHTPIKGVIKRANVSKDILGQYYVSLMCEFAEEPEVLSGKGVVGIDMNIKAIDFSTRSFITLSTGEKIDIPRWYTEATEKLTKIQHAISKCSPGSDEWRKHNRHLKHLYENVSNKKKNWLNCLTARLSREFEYVVIEDLDLTTFHKKRKNPEEVPDMQLASERGVRKAWTETPFGEFKRQLGYKMGGRLIAVNPAYTSQTCNKCGYRNTELTLADRAWKCPKCGSELDRDINAAVNIRNAGLAFISSSIKKQEENNN